MWESISVDEYAAVEKEIGGKLLRTGEVWWRQARPLFYRPLLPYITLDPEWVGKNLNAWFIVQHGVAENSPCNSYLNLIVYDNLEGYSVQSLSRKKRRNIRKAESIQLQVKRKTDPEKLIIEGYPVYRSFYQRTGYAYRKDRLQKERFAQWAQSHVLHTGMLVLGVYQKDELLSVCISCRIGDTVILKTAINSIQAVRAYAPDYMLHYYKTAVAGDSGIKRMFDSYFLQQTGINRFKISHGASVISLPAFLHMPVLMRSCFSVLRKNDYKRLLGLSEKELQSVLQ